MEAKNISILIFFCFLSIILLSCNDNKTDDSISLDPLPVVSDPVPDGDNRALWQRPKTVLEKFGDLSGKTVADIGAGTGFFSFRMIPHAERVVAIEIDTAMINFMNTIKERLPDSLKSKLEIRLVKPRHPGLQPEEVDNILIVNTIGYLLRVPEYIEYLKKSLKPNGQLVIVDFKKDTDEFDTSDIPKVDVNELEESLDAAGFIDTEIDKKSLDYQYIITAKKE